MNQGRTVLVVHDKPAIRRLLHTGLTRAGYDVVEAGSAREALNVLQIDKADLVLLDLGIPDWDGLELIPAMKQQAAIIVVSARDATDEKVTALDLGVDDYVSKPCDSEEVLARIRTARLRTNRTNLTNRTNRTNRTNPSAMTMSKSTSLPASSARAERKYTLRRKNSGFWRNWPGARAA